MWTNFFIAMIVAVFVIYLPGITFLHTANMNNSYAIFLSPLVTFFIFAGVGETCYFTHTQISGSGVWIISTIIAMAAGFIVGKSLHKEIEYPDIDISIVLFYLLAAVVVYFTVFVSVVGSPEYFCQSYDVVHHLNGIQGMLDSSKFTSFAYSSYLTEADLQINPWPGGGFYPSMYHVVAAFIASLANTTSTIALNALNAVLCVVVYPMSMLAFLGYCFKDNKYILYAGSLFVVALAAFPWDYLVYGPLYPNLMGFSFMLLEAIAFMKCCEIDMNKKERIFALCLFFVGGVSLAFTHPSTIFFLAVFLMPYCIEQIYIHAFNKKNNKWIFKTLASLALILVWVLFFVALYHTSIVQKMATFDWGIVCTKKEAIDAILTASYMANFYCAPSAYVVGVFVLLGVLCSFKDRRYIWIVASYVMFCVMLFINDTTEGPLKHFIGSFWYTDPIRFASMAGIVGVILASLGLGTLWQYLLNKIHNKKAARIIVAAVVITVGCFSFLPLNIPGNFGSLFPMGSIRANIEHGMRQTLYSPDKVQFVRRVKDIIGKDAVVCNVPADGTQYVYGSDGLRVLYRSQSGYSDEYTDSYESALIRKSLKDYTENEKVKEVIDNHGIEYVIFLDTPAYFTDLEDKSVVQQKADFEGILGISNETPGFKLVLVEGNNRLYKISRESE